MKRLKLSKTTIPAIVSRIVLLSLVSQIGEVLCVLLMYYIYSSGALHFQAWLEQQVQKRWLLLLECV